MRRRRSRPPRPSLAHQIVSMGVAFLGHRLQPDALDHLAGEIERRATFGPSVTVEGQRAVDWLAARIDHHPEWKAA